MKKILTAIVCILLASTNCFAQSCETSVDGHQICDFKITDYYGILSEPAVSSVGTARTYFDPITGKLRCSEDGAAYADCGSGGGSSGTSSTVTVQVDDVTQTSGTLTIDIVQGNGLIATESPTDEINISLTEAGMEAVLDLADLQGDLPLSTKTSGSFVQRIVAGNGLDSTGASTGENIEHTLSLDLMTATNGVGTTNSASGMEFVSGEISILQGCSDAQIIKWEEDDDKWHCGADAGGSASGKEFWWPASATLPLEAADSIPPIGKDAGTNFDQLNVAFNDSTDECRTVDFDVPATINSGGTVSFKVKWYSAAATSGGAIWDFRHNSGTAEGVDPDQAATVETAAADAVQGTAGQETFTTWTETMSNLGWAAGDHVIGTFCRDANNGGGTDDLVGDALATGFGVLVP